MGNSKDADMSPFEAGRRLLSSETSRMSLMDRTELVFQDMDLVPLLVQVCMESTPPPSEERPYCYCTQLVKEQACCLTIYKA